MTHRSLLVAAILAAAACNDTPLAPDSPLAGGERAAFDASGFTSTVNHEVLPLLPNVHPSLAESHGLAINESGWVAGYTEGPYDGHWFETARATLWTPDGVQDLGVMPPGSASQRS
jgi:hypothetical protein